MLRPADGINQAGSSLAPRVGADRLGDAQELLLLATADARHHLRRVALIVLAQQVQHAARVLKGRVLLRNRVIQRTSALLVVPGSTVASASFFTRVLPALVLRVVLALLSVIAGK